MLSDNLSTEFIGVILIYFKQCRKFLPISLYFTDYTQLRQNGGFLKTFNVILQGLGTQDFLSELKFSRKSLTPLY